MPHSSRTSLNFNIKAKISRVVTFKIYEQNFVVCKAWNFAVSGLRLVLKFSNFIVAEIKIAAVRVEFLIAVKVSEIPPLRLYELKDPL